MDVDLLENIIALKFDKVAGSTWLTAKLIRAVSDTSAFIEYLAEQTGAKATLKTIDHLLLDV